VTSNCNSCDIISAPIFYLTLDGKDPSKESISDLKKEKDFVCISYKDDILHWLEACVKEAVNYPMLRETLKQYIYLIRSLTYQTTNHKMGEEIVKMMLENDEYIEAAFAISNIKSDIEDIRAKELSEMIKNELSEKSIECEISKSHHYFPRLEYYPIGWKNHLIGFTHDPGFSFGIKRVTDTIKPFDFQDVKSVFGNDWKKSEWWLIYKNYNVGCFDLYSPNPWLKKNEKEIVTFIIKQIEYFIDQANKLTEAQKTEL
jgi:hypothetical protein